VITLLALLIGIMFSWLITKWYYENIIDIIGWILLILAAVVCVLGLLGIVS